MGIIMPLFVTGAALAGFFILGGTYILLRVIWDHPANYVEKGTD